MAPVIHTNKSEVLSRYITGAFQNTLSKINNANGQPIVDPHKYEADTVFLTKGPEIQPGYENIYNAAFAKADEAGNNTIGSALYASSQANGTMLGDLLASGHALDGLCIYNGEKLKLNLFQ